MSRNARPPSFNIERDIPLPDALHVRATVAHIGERMARVETIAWQTEPEKAVSKGLFHFLLV
jgi:acyl-coenzyme A thioesterase PaaI-like protein